MKRGKKEKRYRMRGSLASRILMIALVFLVLPLLALVGLLYNEDSRIKTDNNYFIIKVLMDQKEDFIEGTIRHELEFLSGITYLLPKISNPEKTLKELAERDHVSALFHIKREGDGHFRADMASNPDYLKRDYTGLIREAEEGLVFVVDPSVLVFYLTRVEKSGEGAWVTAFTLEHVLQNFPIENEVIHPSSTSLVSNQGVILSSTDEEIRGIHLQHPVGVQVFFHDEAYVALERAIPKTNFGLLIAAPKAINFVDIPYFILKVIVALGLIMIIGGGGALFLTQKMGKPLRNLTLAMEGIEQGDLNRRFKKEPLGFEINFLGEKFNETVDALEEHMETAQRERIERETYEKELKIGEEVQRSILPKKVPDFPGVEMAARFIAAKEVGGDFYDFIPADRLMITIADTAGKGISACLYSLSVRSMLRSYVEIHQELDVIVKETNDLFCKDTGDTGVFVTAFVAFFDPKTKTFQYTNCGHFPALRITPEGQVEKLSTEGMALGVIPFGKVHQGESTLKSGDLIVLFTDGIVEAHNDAMELFGEGRLITFLKEKRNETPQKIVDDLIEEVALFAEGSPQFDDLSLVVIRVS
ncbi:MAG: SpoIIE family protein phosphatase [Chlamydiales bacterium]|nr:SpoIIE family protein phosphatase [Chlamydiales bacterium]